MEQTLTRLNDEIGKAQFGLRALTAANTAVTVLNRAWVSRHGKECARQIVFRQLPFGEFTHIQVRLWLFEGLRLAVTGLDGKAGTLSPQQSDFLWELIQELHQAYAAGRLREDHLVDVILLGIGDKAIAQWPETAGHLPENLRGPVAYVLGCQFRTNLRRPDEARRLFEDAQKFAEKAPAPDIFRLLVEAEVKRPAR